MDFTPAQREAIAAALKSGNKIEAIKLCREATGLGLAEAKVWVERLGSEGAASGAEPPRLASLSTDAIAGALFAGEKIRAIKLYREQRGCELKDAKDAVDKLEAGLRATAPEKFSAAPKKSGCLLTLAGLVLLGVALAAFLR
ncbi:MAG: ribosomal protein L7/L12 [Limisphaerales bacterium]